MTKSDSTPEAAPVVPLDAASLSPAGLARWLSRRGDLSDEDLARIAARDWTEATSREFAEALEVPGLEELRWKYDATPPLVTAAVRRRALEVPGVTSFALKQGAIERPFTGEEIAGACDEALVALAADAVRYDLVSESGHSDVPDLAKLHALLANVPPERRRRIRWPTRAARAVAKLLDGRADANELASELAAQFSIMWFRDQTKDAGRSIATFVRTKWPPELLEPSRAALRKLAASREAKGRAAAQALEVLEQAEASDSALRGGDVAAKARALESVLLDWEKRTVQPWDAMAQLGLDAEGWTAVLAELSPKAVAEALINGRDVAALTAEVAATTFARLDADELCRVAASAAPAVRLRAIDVALTQGEAHERVVMMLGLLPPDLELPESLCEEVVLASTPSSASAARTTAAWLERLGPGSRASVARARPGSVLADLASEGGPHLMALLRAEFERAFPDEPYWERDPFPYQATARIFEGAPAWLRRAAREAVEGAQTDRGERKADALKLLAD